MELGIRDRVAMVLAAGGGLGGAIALGLAREGARVVACDINGDAVRATVAAAEADALQIVPRVFDLSDLAACDAAVDDIESTLGPVQILVNVTGGPPPRTAAGNPADDWRAYFDLMVTPVIHITDRVLGNMRGAKWGRIITSTSSGVVAPIPSLGLSNALRSALVGWSKTLATEVAHEGITVNIVVPGRISTSRVAQLDKARADREGRTVTEISQQSAATIPVGRYGTPDEYADVVSFLSSERASFITGSMVRVDGGMIPSI